MAHWLQEVKLVLTYELNPLYELQAFSDKNDVDVL